MSDPWNGDFVVRGRARVLAALISLLLAVPISLSYTVSAQSPTTPRIYWEPGTFEDNVYLTYEPQVPAPNQCVNVTIVSRATPIQSASINAQWWTTSGDTSMGAYPMISQAANNTIYRGKILESINIYPGIRVVFNVRVWDYGSAVLASKNYTYNVTNAGGWKYDTFDKNIALSYSPSTPQPYSIVNISVRGKVQAVSFRYVQVSIIYQPPGDKEKGPFSLTYINMSSFSGYAIIGGDPRNTPNQPGYNVTFWVAVYDMYMAKMESPRVTYHLNETENPNPDKYSFFVIAVYDDNEYSMVSGAAVEIKNSSRTITGSTNQFGWFIPTNPKTYSVQWLLLGDTYTVSVKFKSATATIKYVFNIDNEANRTLLSLKDYKIKLFKGTLEFHFRISAALKFEEFPPLYLYPVFILAVLVPLGTVWFIYFKQEEERRRLTEEKKKLGHIQKVKKGIKPILWDLFTHETKRPHLIKPLGFFVLGLVGMAFASFYPWWMVLLLGAIVGVLSYKYPYLSLIVLTLFVTASCGYQSPEFGLVFMVFALFVLLVGFFDWKFAFLVFLAIFVGRYGLPFVIPIFATIIYSTFLGIAVAAVSLTFLTFLVTCGNVTIIGFFTGVSHTNAIPTFSLPVKSQFVPTDIGTAFSTIGNADPDYINTIISNNFGSSIVPFFLIVIWCFAFYLLGHVVEKKGISFNSLKLWLSHPIRKKKPRYLMTGALLTIILSSAGSIAVQGLYNGMSAIEKAGTTLLLIASAFIVYTAVVASLITREVFAEYYTSQIGVSAVGTRISEMQALGKTTFEMVGGLHDVKQDLKESMIVPLLRPDISEQFGIEPAKGIMLFGPPGCGKTLMMKALATELHVEMINIKCSDIMSKWYGESEGRMTELFKIAKERRPCIIFFDEVDAIAKKRELYSADDVTPRLLSIMLSELDGMDRSAGIIIVGSTNKPEMCDTALLRPGRFDKIIYVPPPGYDERIDVFRVHLQGKPVADDIDLQELAKKTERFSGADIANLVKEAATVGMRRAMQSGQFSLISMEDFHNILPRIRPSISLSMKEEYEKTKQRYERKMHDLYRTEKRGVISWDDVANLEDVKKELHEFIELPLKRSDLVEQYRLRTGKGVLLYGPPGCGKTYIMKAAANRYNIPMQVINTSDLVNSLVSEGENAMKEIFVRAKDTAPSVVLFVELEMLLFKPETEQGNASMRELFVQNQMISALDSMHTSDKVIVVATTDRPEMISPEFFKPGRFDKLLYIPPPNRKMRRQMLEIYLKDVPKLGEIDYDSLTEKTEGFSGEDISNLVNEAKLMSIKDSFYGVDERKGDGKISGDGIEADQNEKYGVSMDDLLKAMEKISPSVTSEMVKRCEKFKDSLSR